MTPAIPSGWYPNPIDPERFPVRFWDGRQWLDRARDAQGRYVPAPLPPGRTARRFPAAGVSWMLLVGLVAIPAVTVAYVGWEMDGAGHLVFWVSLVLYAFLYAVAVVGGMAAWWTVRRRSIPPNGPPPDAASSS